MAKKIDAQIATRLGPDDPDADVGDAGATKSLPQ